GQLAERSALAAHGRPVGNANLLEPRDGGHASSSTRPSLGCSSRIVTIPRPPSTRMRWPSLILVVAEPVPTTAGSPYSRATIAMWLIDPPMSLTAAPIFWKIGLQVGLVT